MMNFQPKPLSDFVEWRDAEIARLQVLNPDATTEDLAKIVDPQILTHTPAWQFFAKFDQRFMADYVMVIMLSHALCEALINAALAIGLAHTNSTDLFPLLEKTEFCKKWHTSPKSFAKTYEFPKGSAISESLTRINKLRNSFVHHKIDLEFDGKKVLKGSGIERKSYDDELHWIRRFFSLPYDLAEFLNNSLPEAPMMLLFDSRPIERVQIHRK